MIGDFFASILFYALPILTGRIFVRNLFYAWVVGSLLWFFFVGVLSFLHGVFPVISFSATIRIVAFLVFLVNIVHFIYSLRQVRKVRFSPELKPFLLLSVFSAVTYFLIWKGNTPFPLQLNWDIYEHMTLAHLIADGKFSLLPSQISDTFTFNGYTPFFHTILAIPRILFARNLLGIFWWLEYWHYALTILLAYRFARNIVSPLIASLAAVLCGLVFESSVVYASFFFIPQTLAAFIALGTLTYIRTRHMLLFCSLLVLVMTHYAVGLLGVLVVVAFLLVSRLSVLGKHVRLAIVASMVLFGASIALHAFGTWTLTNREEAQHFVFSLAEKGEFILDWYGIAFPVFFSVGAYALIRHGTREQKILLSLAFAIGALSLAPFSYVLKFFVLARYFVNIVVAVGIGYFLSVLSARFKLAAILVILASFFIVFYQNRFLYVYPLYFKGVFSHVSKEELAAGEFLAPYARKGFMISDPSTQYILEAISGINSQGGAYANQVTRETLVSFNLLGDPSSELLRLNRIQDKIETRKSQVLLVLSGRFFAWQRMDQKAKESFSQNIWRPQVLSLADRMIIDSFLDQSGLSVLYQNDEMVIIPL
ncbi:MAG: hypothetical protein A3J69_02205 [Candidatus Levybacteria bacterium RIFCSPHIGHO2_02_FULL_42_12]|nr:MAG: hypothetical protein A2698_00070 [Candidatus Levybacteria bacterium RIFCSPHIGHO2_01_FULL_42_15]OGH30806.1 MAG: hypothetical protein A3J69_02205 [Candidatus Levybacteria bacterium RIFCSPHIGHO2_02_FULL_42_12]OGH42728.1 MAG: hypothetical protein A3B53_00045 [Candidatus Levybacteria bacterium RIFCSPLOWO2_01_FULL_42_15]